MTAPGFSKKQTKTSDQLRSGKARTGEERSSQWKFCKWGMEWGADLPRKSVLVLTTHRSWEQLLQTSPTPAGEPLTGWFLTGFAFWACEMCRGAGAGWAQLLQRSHKPHLVTSLLLSPGATSWRAAPDVPPDPLCFHKIKTLSPVLSTLLPWAALTAHWE